MTDANPLNASDTRKPWWKAGRMESFPANPDSLHDPVTLLDEQGTGLAAGNSATDEVEAQLGEPLLAPPGVVASAHWVLRCSVGATTVIRSTTRRLSRSAATVSAKVVLPAPGVATARKSRGWREW